MRALELETQSAGQFAFYAARDARMRNAAQKSHYTAQEQLRAERMQVMLDTVYSAKKVYINYRQKFIAVKLEFAVVRDRALVRVLEADYALEGIEKTVTAQGITYRIPKA
jgi:allophanate hydrolase subunit 1